MCEILRYYATRAFEYGWATRSRSTVRHDPHMARPSPQRAPTASEQLELLLGKPWPIPGRPPKHDLAAWTVTDDWPDPVPVVSAEIDVFEGWFGDLFDELFGPII